MHMLHPRQRRDELRPRGVHFPSISASLHAAPEPHHIETHVTDTKRWKHFSSAINFF